MHFINYIYFVFSRLWCKPYLVNQCPYIIHRIVAGGIKFMNIQRSAFIERNAGWAFVAGLSFLCFFFAINCFGKNPGAGCFAHPAGSAKQKCMSQLIVTDCIL